jgi:hypothetical protein
MLTRRTLARIARGYVAAVGSSHTGRESGCATEGDQSSQVVPPRKLSTVRWSHQFDFELPNTTVSGPTLESISRDFDTDQRTPDCRRFRMRDLSVRSDLLLIPACMRSLTAGEPPSLAESNARMSRPTDLSCSSARLANQRGAHRTQRISGTCPWSKVV